MKDALLILIFMVSSTWFACHEFVFLSCACLFLALLTLGMSGSKK